MNKRHILQVAFKEGKVGGTNGNGYERTSEAPFEM